MRKCEHLKDDSTCARFAFLGVLRTPDVTCRNCQLRGGFDKPPIDYACTYREKISMRDPDCDCVGKMMRCHHPIHGEFADKGIVWRLARCGKNRCKQFTTDKNCR